MRVSLRVRQGVNAGKEIPIKLNHFLIGRDPQCHLRPASPMISRRHCALIIREGKLYVRDFGSTNGTQVNGQRVQGECELQDQDLLTLGQLIFIVLVERSVPVDQRTPLPDHKKAAQPVDDDAVVAMLLELQDSGGPSLADLGNNVEDVPSGTTILQIPNLSATGPNPPDGAESKPKENKRVASGDTSSAAKALLEKYNRRKRT